MPPPRRSPRPRRLLTTALCGATAASLSACSNPPTAFHHLFVEVGRVQLEEAPSDPIVDIQSLGRLPDGGFILADRHAGKVRIFDSGGRQRTVLGRPGKGPGELDEPTAAAMLPDGRVVVLQGGDPRLTVFDGDSVSGIRRLPGAYGYWAAVADGKLIAGVATAEERFAVIDLEKGTHAAFGGRDPAVAETPFWIFFAREHAAVLGDEIAVNTSFFPTIRLHALDGDSLRAFGEAPPGWIEPTAPPVGAIGGAGDRRLIEAWAASFTVVGALAAVGDDRLVVQYGRHEPDEVDPYHVTPLRIDVYDASGAKLAEDLELPSRIVGGGDELLVLTAEPPDSWTVTLYRLRRPGD